MNRLSKNIKNLRKFIIEEEGLINLVKEFFKNTLIRKPMKINFILTIILDLVALVIVLRIISENLTDKTITSLFVLLLIYIVIFIIFLFFSLGDWKTQLGEVNEQLKEIPEYNIAKMSVNIIVCFIHYIFTIAIIDTTFFFNGLIKMLLIYFIALLLLFRVIYVATKKTPLIVLTVILAIILIFSLTGIEKTVLDWSFLTLILGTIFIEFTNIDVKYLLSKEYREKVIPNPELEEAIKEKLFRYKFSILLYLPLLYITLLIPDRIRSTDNFIYFVNFFSSSHFEKAPTTLLSIFTIYEVLLKVIIFLAIWILYFELKDIVLDLLAKKLITKSGGTESILVESCRYYRVKIEENKRRWEIDRKNYLSIDKNYIIEYQLNQGTNLELPIVNIKCWPSTVQNIKSISNDILKLGNKYFVREQSDVLTKLNGADKLYGNSLLKKINSEVIWAFLIFPLLFIVLYFGTETFMINKYRGVYCLSEHGKCVEFKDKKQEFIVFSGEEVKVIKRTSKFYNADIVDSYKYNNVSLLIKNNENVIIGGVDPLKKTILIYDTKSGENKEYRLKERE